MYDRDANGTNYSPFIIATLAGHPALTAVDIFVV